MARYMTNRDLNLEYMNDLREEVNVAKGKSKKIQACRDPNPDLSLRIQKEHKLLSKRQLQGLIKQCEKVVVMIFRLVNISLH